MEDLIGKTFGEYRLIKHIGSGGMAEVFLAEQTTLKRSAAVKILKPSLMQASGERVVARFRQEAMTAAALSHPNIVQVYTIGEEGEYHYIAQEFVQGNDLASILKSQGPPQLSTALHIMKHMAAALSVAGKAGVVHRDIKPDNVLVNKKGTVKIADFGLAQLQTCPEDVGLTQEGTTLGTPLYMSPEQVRGEDLDQRSDIYSFGITCYQILCGQTPFSGKTGTGIAVQHVTTMAPPLSGERPDLPDVVCRMVHCMMAKRRSNRYQSATEILTDVKALQTAVKQGRSLDLVRLPELTRIEQATAEPTPEGSSEIGRSGTKESGRGDDSFESPAPQTMEARQLSRRQTAKLILDDRQWVTLPSWEESDDADGGISRRRPEFDEMDLTPMVDVTFLLLIFFMITAAFDLQKKFDVAPSKSEESAMTTTIEETDDLAVKVEIGHDNKVYIDDEVVDSYREIADVLTAARIGNAELELQLRIDPASRHEMRMRVNDAGTQAGFSRIRSTLGDVE